MVLMDKGVMSVLSPAAGDDGLVQLGMSRTSNRCCRDKSSNDQHRSDVPRASLDMVAGPGPEAALEKVVTGRPSFRRNARSRGVRCMDEAANLRHDNMLSEAGAHFWHTSEGFFRSGGAAAGESRPLHSTGLESIHSMEGTGDLRPRRRHLTDAMEARDWREAFELPARRRFNKQEKFCFKRVRTPSPQFSHKADLFWKPFGAGAVQKAKSEAGLHQLPPNKGDFFKVNTEVHVMPDCNRRCGMTTQNENQGQTTLPYESSSVAHVLEQIYPRVRPRDALRDAAAPLDGEKERETATPGDRQVKVGFGDNIHSEEQATLKRLLTVASSVNTLSRAASLPAAIFPPGLQHSSTTSPSAARGAMQLASPSAGSTACGCEQFAATGSGPPGSEKLGLSSGLAGMAGLSATSAPKSTTGQRAERELHQSCGGASSSKAAPLLDNHADPRDARSDGVQGARSFKRDMIPVHNAPDGKVSKHTQKQSDNLLDFRRRLLEKFSTMQHAFDEFASDFTSNKELNRKDFTRFLQRHFQGLSREHYNAVFDFLDEDGSGTVSMEEFHNAIEASAPLVRSSEDLRRRWLALGFPTMRQALLMMTEVIGGNSSRRLPLNEFSAALSRVGVTEIEEHWALFKAIRHPLDPHETISIDELSSALAAVSPSLLLEDIRDRLIKRFHTLEEAYHQLNLDQSPTITHNEFSRHVRKFFGMTEHEAAKAFRLIDVDDNKGITRREFLSALRLSEPALNLEEFRKKVRQRFRSIREAFTKERVREALETARIERAEFQGEDEIQKSKSGSVNKPTQNENAGEAGNPQTFEFTFKDFQILLSSATTEDISGAGIADAIHETDPTDDLLSPDQVEALFKRLDADHNGLLTTEEFVQGVQIFAPSCVLEDLRMQILKHCPRIIDVFSGIDIDSQMVLDVSMLREMLEEAQLGEGINIASVFDLVESRKDGGVSIAELIAALQSAAPGMQVPKSFEECNQQAKQEVRAQMAPFHKSVVEAKAELRAVNYEPIEYAMTSRGSGSGAVASPASLSQPLVAPPAMASTKAMEALEARKNEHRVGWKVGTQSTRAAQHRKHVEKQEMGKPATATAHADGDDPWTMKKEVRDVDRDAHTSRSFRKITHNLTTMPANQVEDHSRFILDNLDKYYQSAGKKMYTDQNVMDTETPSLMEDHRQCSRHRNAISSWSTTGSGRK